jgi:hypothetical protein
MMHMLGLPRPVALAVGEFFMHRAARDRKWSAAILEALMKLAIVLIGCGLILAGCESTNFGSQPDPTLQKFNADWEECQKENSEAANKEVTGESPARRCMRAKGYNDVKRN